MQPGQPLARGGPLHSPTAIFRKVGMILYFMAKETYLGPYLGDDGGDLGLRVVALSVVFLLLRYCTCLRLLPICDFQREGTGRGKGVVVLVLAV